MKEPTMTEFERAAEKCGRDILDTVFNANGQGYERMLELIVPLLTSHARPAAGKWRDSNGVDYDCCSDDTQEQTGYRTIVLEPVERERDPSDCPECGSLTVHLDVKPGRRCLNCGTVFSTPAAAQAERGEVADGR